MQKEVRQFGRDLFSNVRREKVQVEHQYFHRYWVVVDVHTNYSTLGELEWLQH